MVGELGAERACCRLAGEIIGRGADAAGTEHDIVAGKGFAKCGLQQFRVITDQTHPIQKQTALFQHLNHLIEMPVPPPPA